MNNKMKTEVFSRAQKGKSLLNFLSDYTVIDLETTGLAPQWDSIIEISALKIRNGKITDKYSSLVNEEDVYVNPFITQLTEITQQMIDSAPRIQDVLSLFFNFLGNDIVIGHNVNFDINFLYDNSMRILQKPFTNNFIDTMRISRRLHPEERHHRLIDLCQRYSLDSTGAHRSLKDCQITNNVYDILKKEALDRYGSEDAFVKANTLSANHVRADEITGDPSRNNPESPLYGKVCVFTGTLEKMSRKDAMQLVADTGGVSGNSVTKKTNYLILGNNDYCTTIKNGKSSKQKKAEQLKLSGQDIEIIPENVFYDMIHI